jgi:hypothetical protein
MKIMDHAALNIKQRLASNFYSCLSPPPCQVQEHKPNRTNIAPDNAKCQAVLNDTINITLVAEARSQNKIAAKWTKRLEQQQAKGIPANTVNSMIHQLKWQYIIGVNDKELRQGIMDGTIPSTIADSSATSGVGTKDDPSHRTGEPSNKQFILTSGQLIQATEKAEHLFNVRAPANELHMTPGVSQHLLLRTGKYADANYITVFDKDTVNVYNANNTIITVIKEAILRGWRNKDNKLWCIPLVDMVQNQNTDTIIVNRPPTEFLPNQPPPEKAIHNVFELKTTPELVRYHHASAGFPTKPQWIMAIKNEQYASWPGLSVDAARRHFPESDETHKGHGRKTPSGLRSTKPKKVQIINSNDAFQFNKANNVPLWPIKKEMTIFFKILDMKDEATQKIWTDQPGCFPKKSSKGSQYMMVLVESESNAILVEAIKNRMSGEMIRAYQVLVD